MLGGAARLATLKPRSAWRPRKATGSVLVRGMPRRPRLGPCALARRVARRLPGSLRPGGPPASPPLGLTGSAATPIVPDSASKTPRSARTPLERTDPEDPGVHLRPVRRSGPARQPRRGRRPSGPRGALPADRERLRPGVLLPRHPLLRAGFRERAEEARVLPRGQEVARPVPVAHGRALGRRRG